MTLPIKMKFLFIFQGSIFIAIGLSYFLFIDKDMLGPEYSGLLAQVSDYSSVVMLSIGIGTLLSSHLKERYVVKLMLQFQSVVNGMGLIVVGAAAIRQEISSLGWVAILSCLVMTIAWINAYIKFLKEVKRPGINIKEFY